MCPFVQQIHTHTHTHVRPDGLGALCGIRCRWRANNDVWMKTRAHTHCVVNVRWLRVCVCGVVWLAQKSRQVEAAVIKSFSAKMCRLLIEFGRSERARKAWKSIFKRARHYLPTVLHSVTKLTPHSLKDVNNTPEINRVYGSRTCASLTRTNLTRYYKAFFRN